MNFHSLWRLLLREYFRSMQGTSSVKQTSALSPLVPEQKLEQLVPLNKLYHHHPDSGTRNRLEEFQVKACLISSHQKCNSFLESCRKGQVAKSEDTWMKKKKEKK